MTKKIILTTILLSASSLILSACSSSDKLRVDVQNNSDTSIPSSETISPPPTSDPSTMTDDQLLQEMESDNDAQVDQEFARLSTELK